MKIWILHDSQLGNGKLIAETMQKALQPSAEVHLGHVKQTDPKQVAEEKPDVVIIGAAIRAFSTSSSSKSWIRQFKKEVSSLNYVVPYGAVFLTHALPKKIANMWGKRYQKIIRGPEFAKIHPEWLSGWVDGQNPPPPKPGVLEFFESYAKSIPDLVH
jgi:menaquinone-dependent protoporphyrinogen IX oxidase